jgi:hypothetical protein
MVRDPLPRFTPVYTPHISHTIDIYPRCSLAHHASQCQTSTLIMDSSKPFPFMDLPIELRLMIYECIPVQIKRTSFPLAPHSSTIISKHIDLAILATCRQIHNEASAVMHSKLTDILATPPSLIVDLAHNITIHKCGGPLWHISRYLASRAVQSGKPIGKVPYLGTGMGAAGARYDAQSDPHHDGLARLVEMWFLGLEQQRKRGGNVRPAIEVALIASDVCPHKVSLHYLRQLARVLFAEHGGFEWRLRKVGHLFPRREEKMRQEEDWVVEHAFGKGGDDEVRAVRGEDVSWEEYEEEWSAGGYYYGTSC